MARNLAIIIAFICFTTPSKLNAETGLSGKSVKEAIQQTLTLNNVSATPIINERKLFPECAGELSINPSYENWKTVSVKCEGNVPWKIIVRNKISEPATIPPPKTLFSSLSDVSILALDCREISLMT